MQTKYCYKCGKEINEDAEFCPNCGAKQNHTDDEPRQSHVDANDDQSESQSNSTTSKGVSMGQAFTLFWKNYFKFSGKSSRSEFWFWYLWQVIISFVIVFLVAMLEGQEAYTGSGVLGYGVIIVIFYIVATFFPNLTLTVRRMRDAGHHNPVIVFILLPLYIFGAFSEISTVCLVLAMIFALVVLVSVCLPSAEE